MFLSPSRWPHHPHNAFPLSSRFPACLCEVSSGFLPTLQMTLYTSLKKGRQTDSALRASGSSTAEEVKQSAQSESEREDAPTRWLHTLCLYKRIWRSRGGVCVHAHGRKWSRNPSYGATRPPREVQDQRESKDLFIRDVPGHEGPLKEH